MVYHDARPEKREEIGKEISERTLSKKASDLVSSAL